MDDFQSRDHAAFGGLVVCALVKGHPKTCSTFMVKDQYIQINRCWFKKKFEEEIRPMTIPHLIWQKFLNQLPEKCEILVEVVASRMEFSLNVDYLP